MAASPSIVREALSDFKPEIPAAVESAPAPTADVTAQAPTQTDPAPAATPAPSGEPAATEKPAEVVETKAAEVEEPFKWPKEDGEPEAETTPVEAQAPDKELEEQFKQFNNGKPPATERDWRIMAGFRMARELHKPAGEGGLGRIPKPDEILEWNRSHEVQREMLEDIYSGDPGRARNFIENFFTPPAENQDAARGLTVIAEHMAPALAKSNPELYLKARHGFLRGALHEVRAKFDRETDPDKRNHLAMLDMHLSYFMDPKAPWKQYTPEDIAKAPDQLSLRQQELDAKERKIQEYEKGRATEAQRAVYRAIDDAAAKLIEKDAEFALGPALELEKQAGRDPSVLRDTFLHEVTKKLEADPLALREFRSLEARARATGSALDVQAAARAYRKAARAVEDGLRAKYVQGASRKVIQASEARHSTLASAAANGTAAAAAQPLDKSIAPTQRADGESTKDWLKKMARDGVPVA